MGARQPGGEVPSRGGVGECNESQDRGDRHRDPHLPAIAAADVQRLLALCG